MPALVVAVALFLMPLAALGQTKITAPSNKYSTSDDVRAGQEAAQQAEQQLPILRDPEVTSYVQEIGHRLVAAIPSEFQHPEFRYTFKVVDARDINAFALPGGPMYVTRGMIEAAKTEGEMAGVMAHEISHVALRHATANATETQKYQIGSVLGQIAGAVLGGVGGQIASAGSQVLFGGLALKYSRKYETQADILGSQIMARAGYDPRDLANMFRTIERQGGGSSGPTWLSSHPSPADRYQRISQEAAMLRVNNPVRDTREFEQVQARLRGYPRARTMEEIARSGQQQQQYPAGGQQYPSGERVGYPSSRYRTYTGGNLFRVSVPDNWQQLDGNGNITFAPQGAYSQQGEFTHGVMFGVTNAQGNNLRQSTDEYIRGLLQNNSYLRAQSRSYQRGSIGGRTALAMTLSGRSNLTGQNELVTVYTTQLRDGNLFYMVAVTPQTDARAFNPAFSNILRSIQLNN